MKIYGTAGVSASMLASRRVRWRRLAGAVVVLGVLGAFAIGRPTVSIVLLVGGFLVRYRLRGMTHAARSGSAGEYEVAARLRAYQPDVLLFDLDLRGQRSDIDAVVLGPVVATVEVKAAKGRVRAMSDGTVRVGGTWLSGHPIAQAARHAAALGTYTEHHAEALLCITRMRGRPRYVEYGRTKVLVTNLRHLRRALRWLPPLISAREARHLAQLLRSGNNPSHLESPSVH